MVLKDPYNRPVSNLRISLTPACNLSCIYCHAEGEEAGDGLISAADIAEIMRIGAEFGIRSVKFTGGEPALRSDLVDIIRSVPPGMERLDDDKRDAALRMCVAISGRRDFPGLMSAWTV